MGRLKGGYRKELREAKEFKIYCAKFSKNKVFLKMHLIC